MRKDNKCEAPFPTDEFPKKPVWVGFETQLYWDYNEKAIVSRLNAETNAFAKMVEDVERRPADYGVIFCVNMEKKTPADLNKIKRAVTDFQQELRKSQVFVVYIEASNKNKQPRRIAINPDGKEF